MSKDLIFNDYEDAIEYHGSTTIELVRTRWGKVIWRDWLIFDTIEEAENYFNDFAA